MTCSTARPEGSGLQRVLEVERAAARTWPAGTVVHRAGWLLRHCSRMRRRRSNSALPPARVADPEAEIAQLVRFYAERSARAVVQVSPLPWHAELDAHLAARGFAVEAPVQVMTAPVERAAEVDAADVEVRLDARPDEGWLAAVAQVGSRPEPELARLDRPVRFATALLDGRPAGVGMFVRDGAWCAVYGMATAPEARGRGVARAVLRAGARWAAQAPAGGSGGAAEVFLQVERANAAALRLYSGAGFEFSHLYHYRVAETAA